MDFLRFFDVDTPVLIVGFLVLVALIITFLVIRNRRPSDD